MKIIILFTLLNVDTLKWGKTKESKEKLLFQPNLEE